MKLPKDYKNLITNFFSLSALQVVNMVLPLVTLPYLVRILGVEVFGLVNLSLSVIMFFNIMVSFGFDLSATREISVNRYDSNKISQIFSTVIFIKFLLLLISFISLCLLLFSFKKFGDHSILYLVTFGLVIGNFLFPTWFFQGMEKMKYITFINVNSRLLFTGLIFLFVKEREDFILVPLFNSLGAILGGVFAIYLILKNYSVGLTIPSRQGIVETFKSSYHFFLSRVANDGSKHYAITLIGLFFGHSVVGYFSIVAKLFYAFMSLGGTVSQTLYPYMSRTRNMEFFKKIFIIVMVIAILLNIPLMLFNELILHIIFDIKNAVLSNIFLITFSGSVFGIASALVGYPLLAAFGHQKEANNSLIFASLIYVAFITLSCIIFKDIYLVSSSLLIYNLSALVLRTKYLHKKNMFSFGSAKNKLWT